MGYVDRRKQNRSKDNFRIPKIILFALLGLEIVLGVVLFMSLVGKGMLPDQAWGLYIGVLAALIALGFISVIRKWSTIVMLIISGIICAALGFGLSFSNSFVKSIEKVTDQGQKTISTMQIAVLKSSDIESIESLSGEQVG